MVRPAERSPGCSHATTCVWMDAGLLTYRLCDRGFDCEHCPLDAALRGEPALLSRAGEPLVPCVTHPTDRLYTTGHLWLRTDESGCTRIGIDAFAALLLAAARRVRWPAFRGYTGPHEPICLLEFPDGDVPIGAPAPCEFRHANELLETRPDLLCTDPYDTGWLAEVASGSVCASDCALDPLLTPSQAEHQARLDLRRFRRQLGLELLTGADTLAPRAPIDRASVTDVRRMLSGEAYLVIVRDLVH